MVTVQYDHFWTIWILIAFKMLNNSDTFSAKPLSTWCVHKFHAFKIESLDRPVRIITGNHIARLWTTTKTVHLCKLFQIIWETPKHRLNLSISCTGHQISWIWRKVLKVHFSHFVCFLVFSLENFLDIWVDAFLRLNRWSSALNNFFNPLPPYGSSFQISK